MWRARLWRDPCGIADFDEKQINNFVENWFGEKTEMAKDCIEKLNSGDYASVKELAQSPLLLTLVCLVYKRSGQFPNKRGTLYDKALRVLLEEWNADKEIPKQYLGYKNLDTRQKELILSEIAYENFFENRLFFEKRDLTDKIEQLLKEILPDEKSIDGSAVIKDIEVQHGLLVERANAVYSFSHLTLQEFLTAQNIHQDTEGIKQLIKSYLCDPRWREVFLLLPGLLTKADNFLLLMEGQIHSYINTPKLQAFLAWADAIVDPSPSDISLLGKRAIATYFSIANSKAFTYGSSPNVFDQIKLKVLAKVCDYAESDTDFRAYVLAYSLAYDIDLAFVRAKWKVEPYTDPLAASLKKAETDLKAYEEEVKKLTVYKNFDFNGLLVKLRNLKEKISNKDLSTEARKNLLDKFFQTLLERFNLTKEMIDFSVEGFESLDNYFYAAKLMLDCKNAAVRVSPETWNEIEERMLRPTD